VEDNMRHTLLLAAVTMLAAPLVIGHATAASAPDVAWAKSKAVSELGRRQGRLPLRPLELALLQALGLGLTALCPLHVAAWMLSGSALL
jgi:hypothetical protein